MNENEQRERARKMLEAWMRGIEQAGHPDPNKHQIAQVFLAAMALIRAEMDDSLKRLKGGAE